MKTNANLDPVRILFQKLLIAFQKKDKFRNGMAWQKYESFPLIVTFRAKAIAMNDNA